MMIIPIWDLVVLSAQCAFVSILLLCIALYVIRAWYFNVSGEDPFPKHVTVGFLHPYCNSGGGGERVLWCLLKALNEIRHADRLKCTIYTVETASNEDILMKVKERFGIDLHRSRFQLSFIRLQHAGHLIEAKTWPRFTMLGQSFGSMVLTWKALVQYRPDVFFDSTGFAFSFIVAKLFCNCKVGCYVHYPTITREMTQRVLDREHSFNNDDTVSRSFIKTHAKWLYYKGFAILYKFTGSLSDLTLVNSSWTRDHIDSLWGIDARVVYPPCNVSELTDLGKPPSERTNQLVSIGQFRPEKDHEKQLEALKYLLERDEIKGKYSDIKLVLAGSCRNEEDEARVQTLKKTAERLKVSDHVEFRLNVSWRELKEILSHSKIGVHTMRSEHFGISVVELMAAGTVTVAHDSAGPKMDIICTEKGRETGFLATTAKQYAGIWAKIVTGKIDTDAIAEQARESLDRFGEREFCLKSYRHISPLLDDVAIEKQKKSKTYIAAGVGGLTGTRDTLGGSR